MNDIDTKFVRDLAGDLEEDFAGLEGSAQICECWGDHTDEGLEEECPRGAAVRITVTHTCDCDEGCEPHQDLLLLCDPCFESWKADPEGYEYRVLGRLN